MDGGNFQINILWTFFGNWKSFTVHTSLLLAWCMLFLTMGSIGLVLRCSHQWRIQTFSLGRATRRRRRRVGCGKVSPPHWGGVWGGAIPLRRKCFNVLFKKACFGRFWRPKRASHAYACI